MPIVCPLSRHCAPWRQASSRTQRPTSTISPVSSSSGMKSLGCDHAARRVLPAQQRLHARGAHVAQVERGLVDEEELALLRAPRAGPSRAPCGSARRPACPTRRPRSGSCRPTSRGTWRCPRRAAAPRPMRARRSRCRCSRSTVSAVSWLAGELERLLERFQQALGDQLGAGRQRQLLGDHHELVAAEAPERVGLADDAVEPRGHRAQQLVAGVVAERVVDALEVVEVDEQRRDRRSGRRRARTSTCSPRSRIRVRFGSPVSASCVAMKASSSWRRASSSSVRLRSVSKTSHIRTRVTSSVSCSMRSACVSAPRRRLQLLGALAQHLADGVAPAQAALGDLVQRRGALGRELAEDLQTLRGRPRGRPRDSRRPSISPRLPWRPCRSWRSSHAWWGQARCRSRVSALLSARGRPPRVRSAPRPGAVPPPHAPAWRRLRARPPASPGESSIPRKHDGRPFAGCARPAWHGGRSARVPRQILAW